MFRSNAHRILTAAALCAAASRAHAQTVRGTVRGVVADSSGAGIANAQVSVVGTDIRTLTGANGSYTLREVWPGAAVVLARRLGFTPESLKVVVPSADSVAANFTLRMMAVSLAAEQVMADPLRGKMGPFNERKSRGVGAFLTRADIEKRQPSSISELLRYVPGVSVTQKMAGEPQPVRMQRSVSTTATGNCAVLLYVDGHPYANGSVDDFSPQSVEGIEVYRSASEIPANFRTRDATCGVIALWTRDPDAMRRSP